MHSASTRITAYITSDGQLVSTEDLAGLDRISQIDVMETWFRSLYEDPAERTPYESREGGYIWIWGGPYEADEVLGEEFAETVDQDVIDSLVDDLNSKCLFWAPTERPGDYDDDLIADISAISDYHANFLDALGDIRQLADTPVDDKAGPCLFRLLYVNVVTTLETYLSDAFTNTVLNSSLLLRRFVETTPDFKKQKLSLADLFTAMDDIEEIAKDHLRQLVWHDLARVKPMYRDVLDVDFPDSTPIFRAVKTRHDLVHRNGKTKEGEVIPIDKGHVLALAGEAEQFVHEIDTALSLRETLSSSFTIEAERL